MSPAERNKIKALLKKYKAAAERARKTAERKKSMVMLGYSMGLVEAAKQAQELLTKAK